MSRTNESPFDQELPGIIHGLKAVYECYSCKTIASHSFKPSDIKLTPRSDGEYEVFVRVPCKSCNKYKTLSFGFATKEI